MPFDRSGDQVPDDHPAGFTVNDHHILHLMPVEDLDIAGRNLMLERGVRTEQQLLAGLSTGVEGALDKHPTEGTGGESTAVLTVERHSLGNCLIDDVGRKLGQPPDIGLAAAEVPALHGVNEEPTDRVAFIGVVLGRVDASLGGDRMGASRRILEAEALDLETLGAEAGRAG